MIPSRLVTVFRKGSRTYFYSSLFFPREVRADVFALYAFVRVADDFVDRVPQDVAGLDALVARYRAALEGAAVEDPIVGGFARLVHRSRFDPAWVESFLGAMRQDIVTTDYETLDELRAYMYGSAEVVGLMMARVLGLPEAAESYARQLGAAMQYVNFLRDIEVDRALGRTYIPREILSRHGLPDLRPDTVRRNVERFAGLMRAEVERYEAWQARAAEGYRFIPTRYRIPVQTAADMYAWTARCIHRDPLVVLEGPLRPSRSRIVLRSLGNSVGGLRPTRLSPLPRRR